MFSLLHSKSQIMMVSLDCLGPIESFIHYLLNFQHKQGGRGDQSAAPHVLLRDRWIDAQKNKFQFRPIKKP
jgi:hypothetical protein